MLQAVSQMPNTRPADRKAVLDSLEHAADELADCINEQKERLK